jgi:peptide/nickel transport system substrate-binding protein
MNRRKKGLRYLGSLWIVMIILTTLVVKEVAAQQEIQVAIPQDFAKDALDAASYQGPIMAYELIYEPLVHYGEHGQILPALAESWDISPDGKVYTFHLRQDVVFSDGTPFDAEAAKFSLLRWQKKHNAITASRAMEAIDIVDSHTIKISYSVSFYPILTEFSYPRPVRFLSPSVVEPAGDPEGKFAAPIGTGPWMVQDYVKDQRAILVKNPSYWGEQSKLDRMVLKVIPDAQTRIMALQSGEVDVIGAAGGNVPLESLPILENDPNITVYRTLSTQSFFLIFKYDKAPFRDIRVRKAVSYAINKASIVADLFDGVGQPAQGLFPPTVAYVTDQNSLSYPYDPEKAKEMLAQAGWNDHDGDGIVEQEGHPLELSLVFQVEEYPSWKPICEVIQSDLAEIGMHVNLILLERAAYYDRLWKTGEYDLILYRTYQDSWNPHGFLASLFQADSKEGKPAIAYGTEKLDSLINQVLAANGHPDERQTLYDQIFTLLYEEAACVPIYYPERIVAIQSRFKGFEFAPTTYKEVEWQRLSLP